MPMKPYKIICQQLNCGNCANFKIASRWSDGGVEDLKTYALVCEDCLRDAFRTSNFKHKKCRTIAGEVLVPPMIFELQTGVHSGQLVRRIDIENSMVS